MRGGSWYSYARLVRAAYRDALDPSLRYVDVGFRLSRGHSAPGKQGPEGPREARAREGRAGQGPTAGAEPRIARFGVRDHPCLATPLAPLVHYAVYMQEDCIDVVTEFAPDVDWLNNAG